MTRVRRQPSSRRRRASALPQRQNEPFTIIIIVSVALAAAGVARAVKEARKAKERARRARRLMLTRVHNRIAAEKEMAALAQEQAAALIPILALFAGAAGVFWAGSPRA